MVWRLNYGVIMNKTLIPLASYKFVLLTFNNFYYGKYLPLTMDIDDYGLLARLWFNNEQKINTFGIL
jgi:hypothetical protein